ncbi:S8 family serine peptidase [Mangrovivirga cuniculi]|uniref:PKD domain-containing protein n=1 Tax=Mangrovivirga cuniculi TaxID=2715131 RepID=A0A4D7JCP4_9BACT|nr:S8 family serine peptidase [Mangrovivirga cuniculi]QCK14119.1 hypothetical protein DCC35_04820 [Mangrovivirga cuniculi]
MKKPLLLILFICFTTVLFAQKRYVIKTKNYVPPVELESAIKSKITDNVKLLPFRSITPLSVKRSKKTLVDELHYITKPENLTEKQFLNKLIEIDAIEIVEEDIVYEVYDEPNDPQTSLQYYLDLIRAYDAWDISKSSSDVVIGIVDGGIDIDHEDLAPKLSTNDDEIPENGIDDDNDGYVDNYLGWDFAGPDTLQFDYPGDGDVGITRDIPGANHGNLVAGAAAAATNNSIGIAGVGYNANLLITKHSYDNQAADDRSVYFTLAGVLYMIEQGADIVNMSFGGPGRSDIWQNVIDFGVENGVLFVAAAGNSGIEREEYPAAYDGVFAVASSDINDNKSSFSNFGYYVDIIAPGSTIFSTSFGNEYKTTDGTSFSAPIVAGAAALIKGRYPDYTPKQIAELLRVSADTSIYSNVASRFKDKLGYGRLDIFNALTLRSPALTFENIQIRNEKTGQVAKAGDTAVVYGTIKNSLWETTNATKIELSTQSFFVEVLESEIYPGVIDSTTNLNTEDIPFKIAINSNIPNDTEVSFKVTFTDGSYKDFRYITLLLNPTYLNIQRNLVSTTASAKGRIGFDDPLSNAEKGIGFLYDDRNLLFEMGLILTANDSISNNVRGSGASIDDDFNVVERINERIPGLSSTEELFGAFDDSNSDKPLDVQVNYRTMVWNEEPNDKYIIFEYEIENQSQNNYDDLFVGLYADWDISELAGPPDRAGYYSGGNINFGYVHNLKEADSIYAAIQTLTGDFNYWAIDNDSDVPNNPWGVYDDFTDEEKIESMTSGIGRGQAGTNPDGRDVSHTVSIGPVAVDAGQSVKVAFAVHAGDSLRDVIESAQAAYSMYNQTLNAPVPSVDTIYACYNDNATLIANGANRYNWYNSFTGGEPFLTNTDRIVLNNIKNDTILYVSNAEQSYESVRAAAVVEVVGKPDIQLSKASATICEGDSITLSAQPGNEYQWSNGSTERSITVKQAGIYTVNVSNSQFGCTGTVGEVEISLKPKPTSLFSSNVDEVSIFDQDPIQFTDQSTDAVTWFYNFGDGTISTEQNPTHIFDESGTFNVSLTVTADNGCQDVSVIPLIVTSVDDELQNNILVYPNPSRNGVWKIANLPHDAFSVRVIDLQGKFISELKVNNNSINIDGRLWSDGMYIIEVVTPEETAKYKLVKH